MTSQGSAAQPLGGTASAWKPRYLGGPQWNEGQLAERGPINFLDEHIASRKDLGSYLELKSTIRRDDIARTAVAIGEIRALRSFSRDDAVDTQRVWEAEQVSELFKRAEAARHQSRQTVEECKRARARCGLLKRPFRDSPL